MTTGSPPPPRPWILSSCEATALSLFLISAALQYSDGHFSHIALAGITAGLLFCVWGFISKDRRLRWPLFYVALACELLMLLVAKPSYGWPDANLAKFRIAILFCCFAAAGVCAARSRLLRHVAFGAAVAAVFVIGVWQLRHTPAPAIDVYTMHQDASAALLSGANPYAIRSRDIYFPEGGHYAPGSAANGWLTFGFPYPPLSLFISSLGYLIAGDCRYAHLVAICAASLLLAFARPRRLSLVASLLLLFTPRVFFVLEQDWTEAVVVFLLAMVVFCRSRYPRAAPWITGLLLASKQYLIFTVPALLRNWRDMSKAALAGVIVTAPLALWNLHEFFRSVVIFHLLQPSQTYALSYMALLARHGIHLPGWVVFLLTAAAAGFVIRKAPQTTAEIFNAVALIMIVFFVFNKVAFCNYYYLVIAALAAAIAVADVDWPRPAVANASLSQAEG